jgi:hypothetical protein
MLKNEEGAACLILNEQLTALHGMLQAALLTSQAGSPWPREAVTRQCARMSAAINIMVLLGMVDMELHDALADAEVRQLGNAKGIAINPTNPTPKEGQ